MKPEISCTPAPDSFFVYGTLQRGQSRQVCWPQAPLEIQLATVAGQLYDLGCYPALIHGADRICGELWTFAAEHLRETLAVIDAIEGHAGDENDLYTREVVPCTCADGRQRLAYTYIYRTAPLDPACRVRPDERGLVAWRL